MLGSASIAQAATFNWSFSNVVGGVSGTVTGTLEVPEGNGVAATSVILTSTTNPIFDSILGVDFAALPNFDNQFNVVDGMITAASFSNDWTAGTNNIALELNSELFGDTDSQNLGLLTIAGDPLAGACTADCLQTAALFGDNTGQTEFAPNFTNTSVPEPSAILGLLAVSSIGALVSRKKG